MEVASDVTYDRSKVIYSIDIGPTVELVLGNGHMPTDRKVKGHEAVAVNENGHLDETPEP